MELKTKISYRNGNYDVAIYPDGTKVRDNHRGDYAFIADFPESMDVTITSRCSADCPMCYAGCTPMGRNADIMNARWVDSVHPYTEMAIGGGNIFEHPDLIPFLEKLKRLRVIANITVNQEHFIQHYDEIVEMSGRHLINGIGVSIFDPTNDLIEKMAALPHCVSHCVLGVADMEMLEKMYDRGIRLLLLGYKQTGRGDGYYKSYSNEIEGKIDSIKIHLKDLYHHFSVVSFDNLALKQLDVKSLLAEEIWNQFYMGDDGIDGSLTSATMYVDMVKHSFSANSMSDRRFPIVDGDTPCSMFQFLKKLDSYLPSRDNFAKAISSLEEHIQRDDELHSKLYDIGIQVQETFYDGIISNAIRNLEIAMHDENKTIDYYIYELCFGGSCMAKDCIEEKGGVRWSLRNSNELYDYLCWNSRI